MKTKINGILTLLLAFMVQMTFAQERTISGIVSDEMGPVADISVKVKGTSTGTVTGFDGDYAIKAKAGDILEFTHVSYEAISRKVGDSNKINVSVKESGNTLDAVVVTAMGIKREKKEIAYVTEQVDSKELFAAQATTAAQGLTGKVAGLNITTTSNGVNPDTKIFLRGMRSVTSSNEALIVIDGSISSQSAFSQLNSNDIASISVLKGATAAALYGSRAANGALLVTTKSGKKGAESFTVGFNSSISFEDVAYMPEFQDEYGSGWAGDYDPVENTNWGPRFDGTMRRIGPLFDDGTFQSVAFSPIKNNLKEFYNQGSTIQNSISISGKDENSSFYMSFGDQHSKGIIPDDKYQKNNFRANATKKMGKVELAINTSYFVDETDVVGNTIGSQNRDLYWFILNTPTNIPLSSYKNWKTDFFSSADGYYNGYYQNPYWAIDTNRDTESRNRLNGNISASWDAKEWLNITGRVSANIVNKVGLEWRDAQSYSTDHAVANVTRPDPVTSFVTEDTYQSKNYTTDLIATGNFKLAEKVSLRSMVGFSSTISDFYQTSQRADNLAIPGFYTITNGTAQNPFKRISQKNTFGYFADVNIGYNDVLFLSLTGRQDSTSTLSKENRTYFYPSMGLSLDLANAVPSLKDLNINFAKLSTSFATVYNDLAAYQINETYSTISAFPYGGLNGYSVSNDAVSSDIKKEKIGTTEFGLSVGMFKNRILFDAAYYITETEDLITFASTSATTGASRFLTNIGSTSGTGLELSLGLVPFKNSNGFTWKINTNYVNSSNIFNGSPENKEDVNIGRGFDDYDTFAVVGEEFPQIKATSYKRDPQGRIVVDATTGDPIQDGLKNLGSTLPKHVFGFTNIFKYKQLSLTGTLDYRTGHVYYSELGDRMEFTGRSPESISANREDFIFPNSVIETSTDVFTPNTNTPITNGNMGFWKDTFNGIKENYVKDASAIKIREVALSYDFSNKLLKNTKINKITIGLFGRNLMTWLPKENHFSDPEFNNTRTTNSIGIGGLGQGPPTKSYGFNLNVQF